MSPILGIPDLRLEKDVQVKKKRFFDALRPIVERENQLLKQQRLLLLQLKMKEHLSARDEQQLANLLHYARLSHYKNGTIPWQELLLRMDTIPLAMVMAQAANESAWGTSRFARQANNLFGQWCFSKGCGLVPVRRAEGMRHEIRVFSSVQASVRSYLRNLNTNRSYKEMRLIRARKHVKNQVVTALDLAAGLEKYSTRGKAYVQEIQAMIRYNQHDMVRH